jgi:hypothetical protein
MQEPFLYKDSAPIEWNPTKVVELIELLTQAGSLQQFLTEADAAGVKVSIPPATINYTKRFLFRQHLYKNSKKILEIIQSAHCIGVAPIKPIGNPYKDIPDAGATVQVQKLGMAQFQDELLTITITDENKPAFLVDPARFIGNGLLANNETVNGLSLSLSRLEALKQQVRATSGTAVISLEVWHCVSPSEYASRRIEKIE